MATAVPLGQDIPLTAREHNMSIRSRVEDAILLYSAGRDDGALLSLMVAVGATSRRRRPDRKKVTDREAFEAFLGEEMVNMFKAQNCNVRIRGNLVPLQEVLYKWVRCQLVHEAAVPEAVRFIRSGPTTSRILKVGPTGIELSHGWLQAFIDVVAAAPQNKDEFGDPPEVPTIPEAGKEQVRAAEAARPGNRV